MHRHTLQGVTLLLLAAVLRTPGAESAWVNRLPFELTDIKPVLGIVDDCCSAAEAVDKFNEENLFPLVRHLATTTFFKIFKVDYLKECPFWVEEYICTQAGGCGICECDEDEVPLPWLRTPETDPVDTTLKEAEFAEWIENEEDLWIVQEDEDAVYLNLEKNPETYTGFDGYNATRIWLAIYKENCFSGELKNMCFEERVFYRLISGFHSSITAHICQNFLGEDGNFKPNLNLFKWKLGYQPQYMKNVYFTLLFLLRAAFRARLDLKAYDYHTGNPEEDALTKGIVAKMLDLLSEDRTCCEGFKDADMFNGELGSALKKEFRQKFRNISNIMDCVSCEKCRVHAKLQILGIGAALKIVMSDQDKQQYAGLLQRNEIIALVNTIAKFSESVHYFHLMRELDAQRTFEKYAWALCIGVAVLLGAVAAWGTRKGKKD